MKKLLSLFLLSIFTGNVLFAQQHVALVAANCEENCNYGFYYVLPKTAFVIQVTVTKTKDYKGYYADYADKLLGLSNVIKQNRVSYALKEVKLNTALLPDESHAYGVVLSSAQKKNNFLTTLYEKEGLSLCYNLESYQSSTGAQVPDFFRNYADLSYMEKDDSFVETKIINGVVTQVPVNKTKIVSKNTQQKAQENSDFIAQIRQARFDILTGEHEVPYTQEAIAYMVEELNKYEQNYIDLFTGFSIEEDIIYTFIVVPDEDETLIPLFAIDEEQGLQKPGVKEKDEYYYLKLEPQLHFTTLNNFERSRANNPKYKPLTGYCIRKAAPTMISLIQKENTLSVFGTYPIYQKGRLEVLPANQDDFDIVKYGVVY